MKLSYFLFGLILCILTACDGGRISINRDDEVRIVFLGDTSFGENYMRASSNILKEKGHEFPLQSYKAFLQSADFVIANLETPITDRKESPYQGEKEYVHFDRSEPGPAVLKAHNIGAVSIANNHGLDFGVEGMRDTFKYLEAHDISVFGAGESLSSAQDPITITTKVNAEPQTIQIYGAFAHSNTYEKKYEFYAKDSKAGVLNLNDAPSGLPDNAYSILFPHWGSNYKWENVSQRRKAEELVDLGYDLIIGHGAHQLQGIGRLDDTWVVYGLGNFMFNSPGRYKQKKAPPYSLIAMLVIEGDEKTLRLYPIHTNNLENGYQGNFVDREQFVEVSELLKDKSPQFMKSARTARDEFGRYFEVRL